jgi:hypothetical protein
MKERLELCINNRWVLILSVVDLNTAMPFSFYKLIEEGDQRYLSNELLQVVCTIFTFSVSSYVFSLPGIRRRYVVALYHPFILTGLIPNFAFTSLISRTSRGQMFLHWRCR